MPTDSNESSTSSSATTIVVPLMTTSTTNTTSTITTTSLSSIRTPTPTRSNSPTQQLDKLKRFLSTLYHFGSDISNEIGERVRALILALVVSFVLFSSISIDTLDFKPNENETRWFLSLESEGGGVFHNNK